MLAKLVCARHKPRQQTVLPFEYVASIFPYIPISDVRMMGGKLGNSIQQLLGVKTMGDLAGIDFSTVALHFGGQAQWICQLAHGIDEESVSYILIHMWLDGLSKELSKRLISDQIKNKRTAENVVFGLLSETSISKTLKINSYNPSVLFCILWSAAKGFNKAPTGSDRWEPAVQNIYLSASRFIDGVGQSKSIMEWVDKRIRKIETGEIKSDERAEAQKMGLNFTNKAAEKRNDGEKANHETSEASTSYARTKIETIVPCKFELKKKESDSEVKLDADGWQIWDPLHFENAPLSASYENEYDPEVAKEVLRQLPSSLKAVCLLLVIVFFIDGRTQWSIYSIIYIASYIVVFGVLLSIFIHFFQVTKAIPSVPWYKLEFIWNTLCALFCLTTFLILAWDWWQMHHGNYRHHIAIAPRNIGTDGWRRRVVIAGVGELELMLSPKFTNYNSCGCYNITLAEIVTLKANKRGNSQNGTTNKNNTECEPMSVSGSERELADLAQLTTKVEGNREEYISEMNTE
uniref:Lipase_3 domain-containing protein n=1 Tax=Heterorhabditis bacteriophora TaxID=37862 RepID=A0A1I7XJY9_HETBA